MQVTKLSTKDGELTFKVVIGAEELSSVKKHVLEDFAPNINIAGFRPGKAPANLIEKNANQNKLQSEVLEHSINNYYPKAIEQLKERPLSNPALTIDKYVPFTHLEFTAAVATAGEIKLADYKKIKVKRAEVKVLDKDVEEVIKSLQKRFATKNDVERAASLGDQVWIDFSGTDTSGKPLQGGSGKEYPLILGSKTFIPGFEENLIGLKKGEEKSFKVKFPNDYGAKALAGKTAGFQVKVNKVQELVEPKLDDAFAKMAGPFQSFSELKKDIHRQLVHEKELQAQRKQESDLVQKIVAASKVSAPKQLFETQVQNELKLTKQNLAYRGQTFEEYLTLKNVTEDEFIEKEIKPVASERVKAALVLSEIAYKEDLRVSREELDAHIQLLKSQYSDPAMQAQLDDPNNRGDIASRMLTEKTLKLLIDNQK